MRDPNPVTSASDFKLNSATSWKSLLLIILPPLTEIYALEKQIQDLQLQLQNRKKLLSAKQQDFISLSIETVSLVENKSEFEIIDLCVRLVTLEVEE